MTSGLAYSVVDRSRGIGGSDVGSIFGLNKWMSLPRLWLQKVGRIQLQKNTENEFQEWGKLLEAPIARKYAEKTGRRCALIKTRTLVHPEFPWMIGNPDRMQWDKARERRNRKGILEIKNTMFGNFKGWQAGGVPASYYLQLQHYLCISGLTWGSFAVLFGGNKLVQFDVQRDEALIRVMIRREADFWELVQKKKQPPITLGAEWNKELAAFFPSGDKGREITLSTPEAMGHARRLFSLENQIEQRTTELAEHQAWIKAQIGEANAQKLLVPGVGRFNWSMSDSARVDLDKLREKYPDAAKECTYITAQRRFLTKALEAITEEEAEDSTEKELVSYGARRIELE